MSGEMTPWDRLERFVVRRALGTLTRVETREPLVALTFDDGPHPASTPLLAELLEASGARGTFFMLGKRARRHPDLVRRIIAGGHAVGHHTENHPSLPMLPRAERLRQMRLGAEALGVASPALFRPPYGHQTLTTRWEAAWLGYQVVTWNVVAIDWLDHSPDVMLKRVLDGLQPGSIVLLHDALFDALEPRYADRTPLLTMVRALLQACLGQFEFVTVPELIRRGKPHYEHWRMVGDREWMRRLQMA